jgi:peptide chain release factor subunit 1
MKDYELRAVIDSLREQRGGGTWLISLYIRPDKSVAAMQQRIVQEISEAESIKSDDTRDRVQSSLQKIRDALSSYKQTPENGVAIFASPSDATVLDSLPFECPENRYHCGKEFVLEPLDAEFEAGGVYGLIVVERGRAAIGVLKGGRIQNVLEKESRVMGKQRAGGQSAQRFARLRENQKHEFFKSVQESAYATFKPYELDGVAIGGTLSSAKEFSDGYTNHEWNVLGTYSVDHGDEQGLGELVEASSDAILNADQAAEREVVQRFMTRLRDGGAAYGLDEVETALERHAVDVLVLTTSVSVDEIERLSEQAEQSGATVEVIEPSFEQAEMLQNVTGGYGAMLRFAIR